MALVLLFSVGWQIIRRHSGGFSYKEISNTRSVGKSRTGWKDVIQRKVLQIIEILVEGDQLGIRKKQGAL